MHYAEGLDDYQPGIKFEEVKYDGQTTSFKDNFWEKLTNLRFRFNDGDFFGKYMAYPDVQLPSEFDMTPSEKTA